MRGAAILMCLASAVAPALAGVAPTEPPHQGLTVAGPDRTPDEVQLDLGLSVIGVAYEHALNWHWSVQAEADITSTYFAPWFDRGDRVDGYAVGLRGSWFPGGNGHGLYVAPYGRVARVTADGVTGSGIGVSGGAFVGWAWRITDRIDIRAGAGAQYYDYKVGGTGLASPFVALDGVVGYRL